MNLTLRNATIDDAKQLLEIYAPYVQSSAVSFENDVPSAKEFRTRIENTLKRFPFIVAEADGKIVAYAYAGIFHTRETSLWAAEVSVYIEGSHRGMGIGKSLYAEIERRLKAQGVSVVYACVAETDCADDPYLDDAGIQFHKASGFRQCGKLTSCAKKFERWYNMVYMEKRLA